MIFDAAIDEEDGFVTSDEDWIFPAHVFDGLPFPPVVLPPEDVLEASMASAPIVALFTRLAGFAGNGRPLGEDGELTPADVSELASWLTVPGPAEVTGLLPGLIFWWAIRAGVVSIEQDQFAVTERGLAFTADPVSFFDDTLDVLVLTGPLRIAKPPALSPASPLLRQVIDGMAATLLVSSYVNSEPVTFKETVEVVTAALDESGGLIGISDRSFDDEIRRSVALILQAFELAGVVHRSEGTFDLTLTPVGVDAVQQWLTESGYDAPVAGEFAEYSAAELLEGIFGLDLPVILAESDAWRERREPAVAVAELAEAVRDLRDPLLATVALVIMEDIGVELAEPHIRKLADERVARSVMVCWLADHDLIDQRELYDPADLEGFLDVIVYRYISGQAGELQQTLALVGDEDAQVRLVTRLGATPSLLTRHALNAIGKSVPVKSVAKAARKALFVHQSRFPGGQ
jgi:hypothetical protein